MALAGELLHRFVGWPERRRKGMGVLGYIKANTYTQDDRDEMWESVE